MNKIILSGNLCQDMTLKYTPNNVAVLNNTIAVRNNYKNANGEYESQFINIVAYKNNAEFLNKYGIKGCKILIEGRLQTRNYTNSEGKKIYVTEAVVDSIEFLETRKDKSASKEEEKDPFETFGKSIEVNDEELPF